MRRQIPFRRIMRACYVVRGQSRPRACDPPVMRWGSELNVDNWNWNGVNDNCEAKSEAESPRPLRGLQVDSSVTRNVPYAVR